MAFYNTYANYVGNGTTQNFAIPFTYNDPSEVVVTRQNGAVTYTFLNSSTLRLDAPLASGDALVIYRSTVISTPKVSYQNGIPVTGQQLNLSFNQLLSALQEANDIANDKMLRDAALNFIADGKRITGMADPIDAQDAATKAFVEAQISVPGPTGAVGPAGPEGPDGPVGPTGSVGPAGPQGITGLTGALGPQGTAGTQGPQGAQGSTGSTGPIGPAGANGPAGPAGSQGPQGAQGVQGTTGATGANFQPSATGLFAGRTSFNAQTTGYSYLATDQALLYFKLSATSGDWSNGITFGVGPQGPGGVQGPTGPTGAQGIQGNTGLTGLTGSTGPTGPTGATGSQGIQGIQGIQGVTGAAGAKGAQWRGVYAGATAYVTDNVVLQAGSAWIAIANTTGNAPPTLPTTTNTWWNLMVQGASNAAGVTSSPTGTIIATNVQAAIAELDGDITSLATTVGNKANTASPTFTGSVGVGSAAVASALLDVQSTTKGFRAPSMTTTQRNAIASPAAGLMIYNTTLNAYQVYNGTAWSSVGGGANGGSGNAVFYENDQTVTAAYTITTNKNAMSAGPITINSGITVTIPSGSVWTIL